MRWVKQAIEIKLLRPKRSWLINRVAIRRLSKKGMGAHGHVALLKARWMEIAVGNWEDPEKVLLDFFRYFLISNRYPRLALPLELRKFNGTAHVTGTRSLSMKLGGVM